MRITAGWLRIELDSSGSVIELVDTRTGANHVHREQSSVLLEITRFDENRRLRPVSVERVAQDSPKDSLLLRFAYEGGTAVDIEIVSRERYARLSVVGMRDATGANAVSAVYWGPLATDLRDAPGEFIGIVREGGFSIGMLSLEPGTDGATNPASRLLFGVARYLEDGSGSCLEAEARDHSRDGIAPNGIAVRGEPGRTVDGSSVALFGCATEQELDVIEAVVLGEGLPHPTLDGVWLKRSPEMLRPSTWMFFRERDVDGAIAIAQRMGALSLSCFHDMFGNWGHFDVDPDLWPSGIQGIRAASDRTHAAGVRMVMYTLTTFLKPHPRPEPYLAPAPDDRLQTLGPATVLAQEMDASGDILPLENRPGLSEALGIRVTLGIWLEHHDESQVVRVGDEIVCYRSVRGQGGNLFLEGCRRGLFHTRPAHHPRGTRVVRMHLGEFRNFYPGTLEMQDEVADRIAARALSGGFGQITFDGHESCLETGHGLYARNRLTKRIYEQCGSRIPVYTGSNLGNYDWHVLSFIRWGEFELEKGFRGTMLDYRLMRQVQLGRSHMPHGLGQYYPSEATVEDIEWVMARAAGWNAAVDFTIFPDVFARNPEREAMLDAIRLWNQAQRGGVFSEEQKRGLRQTDRLYHLERNAKGEWRLTCQGRWRHNGVQMMPSSDFTVAAAAPNASTAPCGIDWGWTHNPGMYVRSWLSDDLVWDAGRGEGEWSVVYPAADREASESLQFVLRLAADAPCAVRDVCVRVDGKYAFSIPVTLEPGQYLSLAHDMPVAFVYDAMHELAGEVSVRGCLAGLHRIERCRPCRIGVTARPLVPGSAVRAILNLRAHEQIKGPPEGGLTEKVLSEMNLCREENAFKLK